MPTIDVYDVTGKKAKSLELKEEVFGIEPNEELVHKLSLKDIELNACYGVIKQELDKNENEIDK